MKRILYTLAAAIIVAGIAVLSVQHYNQYLESQQVQLQLSAAEIANQAAEAQAAHIRSQQALIEAFNKLRLECQKGVEAYQELLPIDKAKLTIPDCGLELVQ